MTSLAGSKSDIFITNEMEHRVILVKLLVRDVDMTCWWLNKAAKNLLTRARPFARLRDF